MFATGDGDPGPGEQEGPAGAAGAQAGVDGNDTMPEAEAGGVVGASAGPREVALEGGNAEEDSDIGPAEEGEEEEQEQAQAQAQAMGHMVDARRFPMAGFRLTFLDLLRSMMNRLHYNNHVLIRPNDPDVSVWRRTRQRRTQQRVSDHGSATGVGPPEVQVLSDGLGEGPVEQAEEPQEAKDAQEAEEAEEASLWETPTESSESSLWEVAQEPAAPGETTECQDENSKEEAQGTRSEGKEEKYNKKEEPEKDLDPAKDRPKKSSLED